MNDIKSPIFCVFDDPYCLWDQDYVERNKEFVAGIDVEHFEFILNKFIDDCSGQVILATVLDFSQYFRSDSLGVKPSLCA